MAEPLLVLPGADDPQFSDIAEQLAHRGFYIRPQGLPATVADDLACRYTSLAPDAFREAATGRGQDAGLNQFVRQSEIAWIEDESASASASDNSPWITWTRGLQTALNQQLFLGLFSFESHFTRYPEGGFYRRHLDAFRGERNRVVSIVTYLNSGWLPEQGGELVIYPPDGHESTLSVSPEAGTLVVFLSEDIPHEVRPCTRTRIAVSGWFRVNSGLGTQLDPPR